MATPHHTTRMALSEIPNRLEQLRVATIPTIQLADEPTPANVLNPTLFDNSSDNIPLTYTSSTQSPDEIVIRQRGRRRITLSWSPEKCSIINRQQNSTVTLPTTPKTPIKNLSETPTIASSSSSSSSASGVLTAIATTSTSMILRSSPRKRLLMNNSNYGNNSDAGNNSSITGNSPDQNSYNNFSPRKNDGQGKVLSTPVMKRLKLEEKPLAQSNHGTALHVMLKGLSHDQLVGIIKNLIKAEPHLEEKIRSEFPLPDISPMEEQLMHIKRNIFKSLPSSRLCKKTDSTAFARASIHLATFKKSIISQSRILYDSKHWDALFDYIRMAWTYIRATPIWDNASHNAVRKHCFKVLSCHLVAALRHSGLKLGQQRLIDLERDMKLMSKDYEEILSCATELNQLLLKLRTI